MVIIKTITLNPTRFCTRKDGGGGRPCVGVVAARSEASLGDDQVSEAFQVAPCVVGRGFRDPGPVGEFADAYAALAAATGHDQDGEDADVAVLEPSVGGDGQGQPAGVTVGEVGLLLRRQGGGLGRDGLAACRGRGMSLSTWGH